MSIVAQNGGVHRTREYLGLKIAIADSVNKALEIVMLQCNHLIHALETRWQCITQAIGPEEIPDLSPYIVLIPDKISNGMRMECKYWPEFTIIVFRKPNLLLGVFINFVPFFWPERKEWIVRHVLNSKVQPLKDKNKIDVLAIFDCKISK